MNLAPESDVLVAQHRHLNLFPGFLQTQHGNRDRTLVVIDEMPELVNVEKISANDIQQNIQLFQQLVETESNPDLENVIEETEEAVDAIETATKELEDVSEKIAEGDIKGVLTELKDATDEIQEAAEETLEAADSVIVAAEDISEKASSVAGRWGGLSKNQKVIVAILTFATVAFAFVSSGYQF